MPKFIIVDHSLSNLDGHHYEYTISIAEALLKRELEVIVLANKALDSRKIQVQNNEVNVLPVFDVDWLGNTPSSGDKKKESEISSLSNNLDTEKYRFLDYKIQIFAEKVQGTLFRLKAWFSRDIKNLLLYLQLIPFSNITLGLIKTIIAALFFFIGSFFESIILISRNIFSSKFKKDKINITHKSQFSGIKTSSFIDILSNTLQKLKINSEDHIFIHTMGINQLEEILYFLLEHSKEHCPHYHLLQRRDVYEPLVKNVQGLGLKAILNQFYSLKLWPDYVTFYTDTDELSLQHHQLSPVQFITLPIPFRHHKLSDNPENIDLVSTIKKTKHIVYLGNARTEKGYLYLPKVIESLWEKYIRVGKIKFSIQSNYNLEYGEPGVYEARLFLENFPSDKVTLIKEVMDTDSYYNLLLSADIVVIPYQVECYRARSSGILTEALSAGKPVVVPHGTWMASQVDAHRGVTYDKPENIDKAIIEIIENYEYYWSNSIQFKAVWQNKHSPDQLINTLLLNKDKLNKSDNSNQSSLIPSSQKTMLLVLDGNKFHSQNNVVNESTLKHIDYFSSLNHAVYVILYYFNEYRIDYSYFDFAIDTSHMYKNFNIVKSWLLYTPETFSYDLKSDFESVKKFGIPNDLSKFCYYTTLDFVYLDNVLLKAFVSELGVKSNSIVCEVSQIKSFEYARHGKKQICKYDLSFEIECWESFDAIVAKDTKLRDKIVELANIQSIYVMYSNNQSKNTGYDYKSEKSLFNTQRLGNYRLNKKSYELCFEQLLASLLSISVTQIQGNNSNKKIAILYPWGDIQERRSGASQRTGLMLDYLREKSYKIQVYTIGQARQFWSEGIYYDYYEPTFAQAELVKQVYQEAYRSWAKDLALVNASHSDSLSDFTDDHWLPWIYYQFRFDPNFQAWLNQITDWADVVILEYPFWGCLVGKMCQEKSVKLLMTAHDVLAKNLSLDTTLGQITLGEELQALKQADEVITLTPDDQKFFANYGISSHCVPIAIDTQKIEMTWQNPPTTISLELWHSQRDLNRPFCLFVGSQHPPNVEAVKQIQVWSQSFALPFDFVVVGSCWPLEWQKQFFALGKVSETDLIYLYHHAALVIAPLSQGTGMSVKTLEAMAYGKALLGTAIAFRGYPIQSGFNALVEDQLDRYPDQISDLLQQPEQLAAIGQQAQEIAQNYDYRTLYCTYEELLRL